MATLSLSFIKKNIALTVAIMQSIYGLNLSKIIDIISNMTNLTFLKIIIQQNLTSSYVTGNRVCLVGKLLKRIANHMKPPK